MGYYTISISSASFVTNNRHSILLDYSIGHIVQDAAVNDLGYFDKFIHESFRHITSVRNAFSLNQINSRNITSSSAMAERPRELDQQFQVGVNLRLL